MGAMKAKKAAEKAEQQPVAFKKAEEDERLAAEKALQEQEAA
eukprot:COSAG02_NODE_58903_length_276_cov_0.559322_1_plen_41_part_10